MNPNPTISEKCAFLRALPDLLRRHEGEWAAFRGDQLLGVDPSKAKLCQKCIESGYKRNEFMVWRIESGIYEDEPPAVIREV